MEEKNILPFSQKSAPVEPQLLERMVREDEGIKFQNEKNELLITRMDKRFETMQVDMDKRFETMQVDMDKRFETMQVDMGKRFETMQIDMDRRFDAVDKRFNRQSLYQLATFSAIIGSAVAIILKT